MSNLTFQDTLNILRLIDSGTFTQLQVEFDGIKLKVNRRTHATPVASESTQVPSGGVVRPAQHEAVSAQVTHGVEQQVERKRTLTSDLPLKSSIAESSSGVEVKPPMAGTYYAAPTPNAAPFVEVGQTVHKGEQLGVVEVMKLFTPVIAPCVGTVRAILVGNEEFVQSDQTLMVIAATT